MRHGDARMVADAAVVDEGKQPLSPKGKLRIGQVASGLDRLGFVPNWIVTSPYEHAVESARMLQEQFGSSVPMKICDSLRPGGSAEAFVIFLATHPEPRSVIAVGHELDLSALASRLIGAQQDARLALRKGGCCLIEFHRFPPTTPGRLVWWLTPRVLRKLVSY